MPQISFQVNVATVEYKQKKNMHGGMSTVEFPTMGFSGTGIGVNTLPSTGMIGIGMDNTADRGDEINLDELQRYIGGGARGF